MSMRFGPIHYLLFDQIRLIDQRTEKVFERLEQQRTPEEIQSVRARIDGEFGSGIGDGVLEEFVFPPMIHQGLADLIARVESRESAAVAAFGEETGELSGLYRRHGEQVGASIADGDRHLSAAEIFETLQQVKLVGMPCDKVLEIVSNDDSRIVWRFTECLPREHWRAGGAEPETLFRLLGEWISGFAGALNPKAQYEQSYFRPDGSPASEEILAIVEE